ncbi:MAG: hypothetical protein PHR26_00975 [Candidatus ainarchaeum sp.]|nr:hypothetical protein [Candidatus ainarchaeum sp.]MDD3975860.1 hypothetical protein [Candidatus ainarchaeum sp.]
MVINKNINKFNKKLEFISKKYTHINNMQRIFIKPNQIKIVKLKLTFYKKKLQNKLNKLNKKINTKMKIYNKIIENGNYKNNKEFKEYLNFKEEIGEINNLINKCDLILKEINKL